MHRLFFILITAFSSLAQSAVVDDLYQSNQDVVDQSELARNSSLPQALNEVILKVVGDRSVLENLDLNPVVSSSGKFVQQFQYRRKNKISDDLTLPDQLEVLFKFNEADLNSSLARLGLPIWGRLRPDIFIVMQDLNANQIISEQTGQAVFETLSFQAKKRGIPVIFPLMDLQDQQLLTSRTIKDADFQSLSQAAERYGAQVTVIATIASNASGLSSIDWQFELNGVTHRFQSSGSSQDAIVSGVDELSDRLAREFSQVVSNTNDAESIEIVIENVRKYSDYAEVLNYISGLQYVENIQTSELDNNRLVLTLKYEADRSLLARALSISHVITKSLSTDQDTTLHYQLID